MPEHQKILVLLGGGVVVLVLLVVTFVHGIMSVAKPAGSSPFMPAPVKRAAAPARRLTPQEIGEARERARARLAAMQERRRAAGGQ